MRVYLASPFFTPEQLSVVEKLEALIMSFDRLVLYSPRADGVLTTMTQSARNMAASIIFDTNVKEIEACDFMLAVIDGRDIGVIWEMGFAYAKKKPIITYTDHDFGLNVMLKYSVLAHTYGVGEAWHALDEFVRHGVITQQHGKMHPVVT